MIEFGKRAIRLGALFNVRYYRSKPFTNFIFMIQYRGRFYICPFKAEGRPGSDTGVHGDRLAGKRAGYRCAAVRYRPDSCEEGGGTFAVLIYGAVVFKLKEKEGVPIWLSEHLAGYRRPINWRI